MYLLIVCIDVYMHVCAYWIALHFFSPNYILSLVINSYYKNVDLLSGYLYCNVSYCINCIVCMTYCIVLHVLYVWHVSMYNVSMCYVCVCSIYVHMYVLYMGHVSMYICVSVCADEYGLNCACLLVRVRYLICLFVCMCICDCVYFVFLFGVCVCAHAYPGVIVYSRVCPACI